MSKHMLFQWCPEQGKVVPAHEVARRSPNARDLFIQDEMEPTRNPLNPKEIYTSKSKLRAAYRAAGVVEVGDAYDRGYNPEQRSEQATAELSRKIKDKIVDRYRNG